MNTLLQDLRYAARSLLRSPGFALVAVVTLALGIGANTALFGLLNALLFRSLPGLNDADRLLWVSHVFRPVGVAFPMPYSDHLAYRDRAGVFSDRAVVTGAPAALGGGEPERVRAQLVSANFFQTLGVRPALGRAFLPEEGRTPGTHSVAVISDALWRRRFDADPRVIGRRVVVNGTSFTVVGVAPPRFGGLEIEKPADLWVPVMMHAQVMPTADDLFNPHGGPRFSVIGRLRPGVSAEQADAAVRTVARQLAAASPKQWEQIRAAVAPVRGLVGPDDRDTPPLVALAAGVTGIVLLIACANLANLLLARGAARRREIGIRLALGASRARIIRQLLTESTLLALLGGALGLLVAFWATDVFLALLPISVPLDFTLDARVLGVTLALALGTGLLFGLAPALGAARPDVVPALKEDTGGGVRRSRLQGTLVVAQVALSLVLLVGAGLLMRSLQKAGGLDVGFDGRADVLTASLDLGVQGYTPEASRAFYRELLARAEALPDVRSASLAALVPLNGTMFGTEVTIEGRPPEPARFGTGNMHFLNNVWPGFFRTIGTPLVRGRDFTAEDREGAPGVVILNETAARRFWPGEDPLGKRIRLGDEESPLLTVVGIAKDGRYDGLGEDEATYFYRPEMQAPSYRSDLTLFVRTTGDASRLIPALRAEVRTMDPNLPVFHVRTLQQVIDEQLSGHRIGRLLLAGFGGLAMLLAMIGLYGVMAYRVAQRTREIGVRTALGARGRDVLALFVGEGVRLAAIGIGLGLVLAAALARVLRSVILGVTPTDPATFAAVTLLLTGVALLASYLPARRAARVEPIIALRSE